MSADHFVPLLLTPSSTVLCAFAAALVTLCLLATVLPLRSRRLLPAAGKAVLISGCDSGIGLRVAQHLHARGFHVFAACLDLQGPGACKLSEKLSDERLTLVQLDVTDEACIRDATGVVTAKLKELQVKGEEARGEQRIRDSVARICRRLVGSREQRRRLCLRGV